MEWAAILRDLVAGLLIAGAIATFVCSIGNVPLAVVLWKGGISFGGVIAFIYADLLILPILNIYRRYYGARMAGFLLVTLFTAMAVAGSTSPSCCRPRVWSYGSCAAADPRCCG